VFGRIARQNVAVEEK